MATRTEGEGNTTLTMYTIVCPNCEFLISSPTLHCMRCSRRLWKEVRAEGLQIAIDFEGGRTATLAVYRQNHPVTVKQVRIEGTKVRVLLDGDHLTEQPCLSLFKVLHRGDQLWELEY
jgi:hypothetical protein